MRLRLSGWAEAPGNVSHQRCARRPRPTQRACRAVCSQAAAMRLRLSGWAEAPGNVSHQRCARRPRPTQRACRAVCPQAAAMRLRLSGWAEAPGNVSDTTEVPCTFTPETRPFSSLQHPPLPLTSPLERRGRQPQFPTASKASLKLLVPKLLFPRHCFFLAIVYQANRSVCRFMPPSASQPKICPSSRAG